MERRWDEVWNRAYPGTPSYVQYGPDPHNPEGNRDWYVDNTSAAPLLEVSRSDGNRAGRLYWSRDFSAPDGLAYDDVAFSKWIDGVWRWVRKHSTRLDDAYWLPHAHRTRKP